jgi:hypothetical protein
MAPVDVLQSIAEIAIGLAGFSGLVAAFAQRPGHTWKGDQKVRIVILVILSFGMMIAALLPFALSGISESEAVVWGVPMVSFSTVALFMLGYWAFKARKYGFRLQFPFISLPIIALASTMQIVTLLSGFGLIVPYSPAVLVAGMLSVLLFAATMFLALLHITWND